MERPSSAGLYRCQSGWLMAWVTLAIVTISRAYAVEETRCSPAIAKVVELHGEAEMRSAGSTHWRAAHLEQPLCGGDMLHVFQRSRVSIWLAQEDTTVQLDEGTVITLPRTAYPEPRWLELFKGAAYFLSRTPGSFKVTTPFLNAHIEGTEFLVHVRDEETEVLVLSGAVLAENRAGRVELRSGQQALARTFQSPRRSLVIHPRKAVEWASYYPPIIDYRLSSYPAIPSAAGIRKALESYRRGDLSNAFANLEQVPAATRDASFLSLRAGLLLTVGRVEEARADLNRALELDPDSGTTYSLRSVIAMVQNQEEQALDLARKAEELEPESPIPKVALSYVYQARFDLESALKRIELAVTLAPTNALVYARLAELRLSQRDLERALSAAKKAAALDPELAQTQTVLGFAYLTEIDIDRAKESFGRAIELDSAAPLPRLGLGLAKIKQGDLEAGREQIEIAASLDPNNSIVRSYLGKAYYEEKRSDLAREEFKTAKELDPNDPTPYFYDAIREQTQNLPVEALHDLKAAIKRNDNRTVYRSRLLLDEDLAARSASLGRIYQELGFEQLGLVEAWKSVNSAPTNYSAHRFLADSYSALPRHQTARASELLQAQLLQPINVTPIQPQLAETNLFIQEGVGPTDLALNEYNPLFNRDRFALMASSIVGSNGTFGDQVVHSGIQGRFSYSLGQFHFETDGVRPNNDYKNDLYNLFLQTSLSESSNVQFEFRSTEADEGDRGLSFFRDDFKSDLRQERKSRSARIGFHQLVANHSHLIGSFIYKDLSDRIRSIDGVRTKIFLNQGVDESAYVVEGQYQLNLSTFNLVSGGGHFNTIGRRITSSTIVITPNNQFEFPGLDNENIRHSNLYAYSYINRWKHLTAVSGISADFFKGTLVQRNQINPKFGLIWMPYLGTTFRAAAFRVLETGLSTVQTIEPTQVAGFSQFLATGGADQDIQNGNRQGIDAWRFALASTHSFSPTLDVGVEVSARKLRVQGRINGKPVVEHWRENMARGYSYWRPHSWFAASLDYSYEHLQTGELLGGEGTLIQSLETHRIPIGLSIFHPCGLSAKIGVTYIDQRGQFFTNQGDKFGADHFWLVNASIRYRLPNRYGLVTFGVNNLLAESFNFREIDPLTPTLSRNRFLYGRISLSF